MKAGEVGLGSHVADMLDGSEADRACGIAPNQGIVSNSVPRA